jgi:ABC-type Fe3+/spermidine/putrescine transport system ATPase subunit
MSTVLALTGIGKRYGAFDALSDIELSVESGSFLSLLGPSGCGKTTLLRIIAGILSPDSGDVLLSGRRVTDDPPYARDLAMVFQDYALFPHMNVFDNVAFGIRMRGTSDDKRRAGDRVREVLDMVRLGDFGRRFPSELSGGQQQRVAIARALAPKPALLLMDEPLSNLDAKVREEMRSELKEIQRKAAVTTVYVTHDQEEALALSDTVVVMANGRIAQVAPPQEIYAAPRDRFVANFVGKANLLEGALVDDGSRFKVEGGPVLELAEPCTDRATALAIRPEHIALSAAPLDAPNCFAGILERETYTGATTYAVCDCSGIRVSALIVNRIGKERFSAGQRVYVTIPPAAIRLLPDRGPGSSETPPWSPE